jgi:D-alanine-D-alanine ligase
MGSSVGVTKAHDRAELDVALEEAARYDEYVVVEESVSGREIEVAVLGNERPRASVPGEIVPGHEFYDYEDKYLTDGADLLIPAKLDDDEVAEVQRLAVVAYTALRVDGMARVDFFYETGGRGWLVNELNTIPGFTPISMYPKLWAASGLSYSELVDELVRLAVERHERRQRFETQR